MAILLRGTLKGAEKKIRAIFLNLNSTQLRNHKQTWDWIIHELYSKALFSELFKLLRRKGPLNLLDIAEIENRKKSEQIERAANHSQLENQIIEAFSQKTSSVGL